MCSNLRVFLVRVYWHVRSSDLPFPLYIVYGTSRNAPSIIDKVRERLLSRSAPLQSAIMIPRPFNVRLVLPKTYGV